MPDIQMTPGDRNPNRYRKHVISAAMVALIAAGASQTDLFNQFRNEKEAERTVAYLDGSGVWTICGGLTRIPPVGGAPVYRGMRLTADECREYDEQMAVQDFLDAQSIIKPEIWARMSAPQRVAAADFIHNLGKAKAKDSTYIRELNAGHLNEACAAITLWIRDGNKDCRKAGSNCQGQPIRRMQEDELCLSGSQQ
jgi:lysozyme